MQKKNTHTHNHILNARLLIFSKWSTEFSIMRQDARKLRIRLYLGFAFGSIMAPSLE